MAASLGLTAVIVDGEDISGCCGTSTCQHTIIKHGDHVGYLAAGKVGGCTVCFVSLVTQQHSPSPSTVGTAALQAG